MSDPYVNLITWDQDTFAAGDVAELKVGSLEGLPGETIRVEGEQIASGLPAGEAGDYESSRYQVSLTESMGDYLEFSIGDRNYWAPLGEEDEPDPRRGEPPTADDNADAVDSAPKRGAPGGPENTMANANAAYEDVETTEQSGNVGAPDPSTYRELANWDWVPDAIPSSGRRAAGLLAAGIVALVVLPVLAASGSSSSSTSSSDGGDR